MKSSKHLPRQLAAAAAVAALGGLVLSAGPASATPTLPPALAMYANCPVQNPEVSSCVYIETHNTQLKIGKFNLQTAGPVTLEFGLKYPASNNYEPLSVAPTNGHAILTSPAIEVPGGIFGIPGAGVGALAAYVTPELTALPTVNIDNLLTGQGTALGLKMRAKVNNPFTNALSMLGPGCYIGSASSPISLNLTTGTTAPPAPNKPITGSIAPGTAEGWGIDFANTKTVDNAFAAPGATGCGTPFGWLNSTVNAIAGTPAAAGTNTAVMTSDIHITDANEVREALGMADVYQ